MNAGSLDRLPRALNALRLTLAVLAVAVGGSFATFGGCVLPTQGLPNPDGGGGGGSGPTSCNVDSDCNDDNACTTDTCGSNKLCQHAPLADGPAPSVDQTPGNCIVVDCKAGMPVSKADPTNLPPNTNDCKTAGCNGEMPFLNPKDDGTPCMKTTATGETAGTCQFGQCTVACGPTMACPDMGPCQMTSCDGNTGTCLDTDVPDGTPTPGVTQMQGNCKINECMGGMAKDVPDDSNVPTAPNDCQIPTCTGGVATLPPVAKDHVCGTFMGNQSGYCDGAGDCVECNEDSECSGTINDCEHPSCTASKCGTTFAPTGMATTVNPAQTVGDCQEIECNGSGSTMSVDDDADTPANGLCTTGTCMNGMPKQVNNADGSSCGGGLSCSGGVCKGCTTNAQCQGMGMTNGKCMAPNCVCTPSTCMSLGKTCGAFPDGCGGMLNCSGAQNGSETDVDCGGNAMACSTRCNQGQKCGANSDCGNGICADGVCCNQACGGCMACTAALKGGGGDGTCGAVKPSGSDPHGACTPASMASTCGADAMGCNGNGGCIDYASGTVCKAATCAGTVLTATENCNGTGTCSTSTPVDCSPNQCSAAANGCTSGCMGDGNCGPLGYCVSNMCALRGGPGATCTATDQCLSGFCVDGFCCSTACNGACQACAASLKASGSGTGTCGNAVTGAVCAAQSCMGSMLTSAKTCNSSAMCNVGGGTTPCGEYVCNAGMTACDSSCTPGSDVQCVAGAYCNGGMCTAKGGPGAACNQAAFMGDDCASGFCADGVCCNSACNGNCMACTMTLTGSANGTCATVPSGMPAPPGQCTANGSCGNTGDCAAGGVCQQMTSGTSCGSGPQCNAGNLTMGGTCSGTGTCNSGSSAACMGGFVCLNGTTCKTSCASDADCELGTTYCMNPGASGTCVAKGGPGAPCSANDQCTSTFCADSVCCNNACNQTCQACTAALTGGTNGTCGFVTAGSNDPNHMCTTPDVCNGLGGGSSACVACATNAQCAGMAGMTVCNTTTNMCVECTADSDCTGMSGMTKCDVSNDADIDTCVQCNANPDCPANNTCMTHVCLLNNGQPCTMGSQCASGTCNPGMMTCM